MIKYLRFLSNLFEDYRFSNINPKILTFGHVNRKSIELVPLSKGISFMQLLHSYNLFKINIMKNSLKKSSLVVVLVCFSIFLLNKQSHAQKLIDAKLDNKSVQNDTERIINVQHDLNIVYEDLKNDEVFQSRMADLMNSYGIELGFSDIVDFMSRPIVELDKTALSLPNEADIFCRQLEKIILHQRKKN